MYLPHHLQGGDYLKQNCCGAGGPEEMSHGVKPWNKQGNLSLDSEHHQNPESFILTIKARNGP